MSNKLRIWLILIVVWCCLVTTSASTTTNQSEPERVYKLEELSKEPVITSKPDAQYTEDALKNEITGTVELFVTLRTSRHVTDIRVRTGLPYGLTERAIAAARKVKFTPGEKDGVAVSVRTILKYEFKLPPR